MLTPKVSNKPVFAYFKDPWFYVVEARVGADALVPLPGTSTGLGKDEMGGDRELDSAVEKCPSRRRTATGNVPERAAHASFWE